MDKNKVKLAKVIFFDNSYSYAEIGKSGIKISSITKVFNKNRKIIKRNIKNIDWNNKNVTIEYNENKIYKGKINKYGKLENGKIIEIIKGNYSYNKPNGKCKITFINKKININRTVEGRFKNGRLEGYCEITFNENDIFSGYNLYDEFTSNILNEISNKRWQLTGKGKYVEKDGIIISEGYFENGRLKDKIVIEIIEDNCRDKVYKIIKSNKQKINPIVIDNNIKNGIFLDIEKNKFILLIKDNTFELKNTKGKFDGIIEIILFNKDKSVISNIEYYFRDGVLKEKSKKIIRIISGSYNEGKLNGECKITYFNEKININRTIEGIFKDGKPEKKYKIISGKNDIFESSIFEGEIEADILDKIYRKDWYLTKEGKFTVFVGESVWRKGI